MDILSHSSLLPSSFPWRRSSLPPIFPHFPPHQTLSEFPHRRADSPWYSELKWPPARASYRERREASPSSGSSMISDSTITQASSPPPNIPISSLSTSSTTAFFTVTSLSLSYETRSSLSSFWFCEMTVCRSWFAGFSGEMLEIVLLALEDLRSSLRSQGSNLMVRFGTAENVIQSLVKQVFVLT